MGLGEAEESVDGWDGSVDGGGYRGKADIERELELASNGGDAANNIRAVDGAAIPSIRGAVGGLHENFVGATVVSGDGCNFVEEAKEAFDTDGFVVAAGSGMEGQLEDFAKAVEMGLEDTVGVDDDEAAETDFKEE